jgi:uncharacterized membrane protein
MGKNNSVNGDVMFKFDASKYDIKDGNVTFWVWSPDIPSLGSVPIPASSTQGSAQSQTGNAAKLGYSSATAQSDPYYYIAGIWAVKVPYIYLEVKESYAFHISIRAKLFDTNDNPMPNRKMKLLIRLYPPVTYMQDKAWDITKGFLDWLPKPVGWIADTLYKMTRTSQILLEIPRDDKTDNNGEFRFTTKLNTTYIKFGTLEVWVGFDEVWSQWWPPLYLLPGTIYTSLTMPVGKRVTVLTDVDKVLDNYKLKFSNTTRYEWLNTTKTQNGQVILVESYKIKVIDFSAVIGKTAFRASKNKFEGTTYEERMIPYITFNFTLELNDTKTDITETRFNNILDSEGRSDRNAKFSKVYDKTLNDDLKNIDNNFLLKNLSDFNADTRILFKQIWLLKYPKDGVWGDFENVRKMYKDYILGFKQFNKQFIIQNIFSYFTALQITNGLLLGGIDCLTAITSPSFLYSLTLTTGDYSFILAAMRASLFAINESLRIGLKTFKDYVKKLLDDNIFYSQLEYAIINAMIVAVLGALTLLTAGLVAIILFIISLIATALGIYWQFFIAPNDILMPEFNYLSKNIYSPRFLLNLVKLTEYDLTLLNYEFGIWDQLRD